jgi:nucleoside-diphosphate-sugar epimerase
MKILIAGGTGFIGSHIVESLKAFGHEVWLFKRDDSIKWGSICHADLVINCAGETRDKEKMIDDNLNFSIELTRACHAFKKKLIHIGSMSENISNSFYAKTKRAASDIVAAYINEGADFCVVSPSTVFGPNDNNGSLISNLWDSYINNKTFSMVNEFRDWVYVKDLAEAVGIIVNHWNSKNKIKYYELGYGQSISNAAVAETFAGILGREPFHQIEGSRTLPKWYADIQPIYYYYMWQPKTSLRDGIESFINQKIGKQDWVGAEL